MMINISAWIADAVIARRVSVTTVRKLMQTIGLVGAAACILLAVHADSAGMGLLVMCLALGASGFMQSGFACNHLDIAPRHAGALSGITSTTGTLPGIVGLAVTGWLIDVMGSFHAPITLAAAINGVGVAGWLTFATGRHVVD